MSDDNGQPSPDAAARNELHECVSDTAQRPTQGGVSPVGGYEDRREAAARNEGEEPNPLCGLSVDGVNLWGDEKSIQAAKDWMHAAGKADAFRLELLNIRYKLDPIGDFEAARNEGECPTCGGDAASLRFQLHATKARLEDMTGERDFLEGKVRQYEKALSATQARLEAVTEKLGEARRSSKRARYQRNKSGRNQHEGIEVLKAKLEAAQARLADDEFLMKVNADLQARLEEAVREREDYNGKHQQACLEIGRLDVENERWRQRLEAAERETKLVRDRMIFVCENYKARISALEQENARLKLELSPTGEGLNFGIRLRDKVIDDLRAENAKLKDVLEVYAQADDGTEELARTALQKDKGE